MMLSCSSQQLQETFQTDTKHIPDTKYILREEKKIQTIPEPFYLLRLEMKSRVSSGRMTRCSPMSLWLPSTHTGTCVGTLGSSLMM